MSSPSSDPEPEEDAKKEEEEAEESGPADDPKQDKDQQVDELAAAVELLQVTAPAAAVEKPPEALQRAAEWLRAAQRIVVLSGAGVSVAAGIPDFRTPGTGLYDNLQKYDLPFPEAVFDLRFYAQNPQPFCTLSKEIWPGIKHAPTLTHSFVALLAHRQQLLRNYSQNIDGLEYLAQIPPQKLVECHGHFRSATCIACGTKADAEAVKERIVVEGQVPKCHRCESFVKPDIVFFGEGLPDRFHTLLRQDLQNVDMLIILGTSLQVAPVSLIPEMVPDSCKRVLLNRELVGDLDVNDPHRDLFHAGDCDDSIQQLAALLGWQEELLEWNQKAKDAINNNSKNGGDKNDRGDSNHGED